LARKAQKRSVLITQSPGILIPDQDDGAGPLTSRNELGNGSQTVRTALIGK